MFHPNIVSSEITLSCSTVDTGGSVVSVSLSVDIVVLDVFALVVGTVVSCCVWFSLSSSLSSVFVFSSCIGSCSTVLCCSS